MRDHPRTGSVDLTRGRTLAASILKQVEAGRRLDVAWRESGAEDSPERGWIRALAYGTVRLQGRLDNLLARYCDRTLGELDPPVRRALRMGAFQILEMTSVPDYAAVSQSVEYVRRSLGRAAAGLVNAVLRRVARHGWAGSSYPDPAVDMVGHLTEWGSHPSWLVERWIAAFGPAGTRALVEMNNREADTYMRPIGTSREEAVAALAKAGIAIDEAEVGAGAEMWICLPSRAKPADALAATPGIIQDPAASLVVEYAAPDPGSLVADLCAAPGGKALALGETGARVLAADISPSRLSLVADGWRRLARSGAAPPRPWTVVADARFPPVARADAVILDAPCSGTGTFRRRPDGRWRVTPETLRSLRLLQRELLDGAASAVPPGGLLVYATCSLEPEENWCQIRDFLARRRDFRIDAGAGASRHVDGRGCLSVLPHESGFDGAFAARMRRTG